MKVRIILENGIVLTGISFGAEKDIIGEIVFNTAMTGYQEILTDPSYSYQIVTLTYPLIGNYGINDEDFESEKVQVSGLIVKEYSKYYSNRKAKMSLSDFLIKNNVPAIEGIDTRYLTRLLRINGSMMGIISFNEKESEKSLLEKLKKAPKMQGLDLVKNVTKKNEYIYNPSKDDKKYRVFVYDFGVKKNILRLLDKNNCYIKVVSAFYPAEDIIKQKPDGVLLSNGPGDPEPVKYAICNIQKLLKAQIPLFGICLGNQLLGLAIGAKTLKLKFGHHGGNHPVKNLKTEMVEITSQNHNFNINEKTLPKNVEITHINLNDNTIEGIKLNDYPAFSIQYHPEASPGPHDSYYLFEDFTKLMDECRKN